MKVPDDSQEPVHAESIVPIPHLADVQASHAERKRAEDALQESEKKFRTVFDSVRAGILIIDADTHIIADANPVAIEMIGEGKDRIVGSVCHSYVCPAEKGRCPITDLGQRVDNSERKLLAAGGKSIPIIKTISTVVLGGKTHLLESFIDVTARKHAEEEAALLQEQLRHSQKMEAIGQLAGGIAHDFNNLLTIIRGYAEFTLFELKDDSTLKEGIGEIHKAANRAAELTKQLLAFSRRQVMKMQVLELNTLLGDLDKMLHRVISEDIEVVTLPAPDVGSVRADPGQIDQVVMNLAINARDAMPSGGRLIIETANVELDEAATRTHAQMPPGRYVMLSVSDTGSGMTPEVRERIFEPFFTTKERGKGTGLGLATVYGIVKQSGGFIWVYSEPSRGTTFKIYLPRIDNGAAESREGIPSAESLCGSETILIVEDEEGVRELARKVLENQGYRVIDAASGEEALMIARECQEPIHLILTDVVMPGMNGREMVGNLQTSCPAVKVIYMSGYTDNTIIGQGLLQEKIDFIQKPFTLHGLAKKVREVLALGSL